MDYFYFDGLAYFAENVTTFWMQDFVVVVALRNI